MSDAPTFHGFVHPGGKLVLDYPAQFTAYAKHLGGDVGQDVTLKLVKRRSQRSDSQNEYWWAVVVALLAEHCGYHKDEMHEALKAKFLSEEDLSRGLIRIGSTAKLDTQAFEDLAERVRVWAAEALGVIIPLPDKRWREKRG